MFEGLKKKTVITEKEKNYSKFNFKKATNVGNYIFYQRCIRGSVMCRGAPLI